MGSEGDLALLSYRCIPRRLMEHDFEFAFADLKGALADLYRDR
jgi:NAD dependent epimerase/dehydratase family enzyme